MIPFQRYQFIPSMNGLYLSEQNNHHIKYVYINSCSWWEASWWENMKITEYQITVMFFHYITIKIKIMSSILVSKLGFNMTTHVCIKTPSAYTDLKWKVLLVLKIYIGETARCTAVIGQPIRPSLRPINSAGKFNWTGRYWQYKEHGN